mmetsp:Transcript_7726/g.18932  ORF Transcript_7726/g.18932 Transcript_7726/m.18932 type:complete len:211 (-) Transcript_7726:438-1070(-)
MKSKFVFVLLESNIMIKGVTTNVTCCLDWTHAPDHLYKFGVIDKRVSIALPTLDPIVPFHLCLCHSKPTVPFEQFGMNSNFPWSTLCDILHNTQVGRSSPRYSLGICVIFVVPVVTDVHVKQHSSQSALCSIRYFEGVNPVLAPETFDLTIRSALNFCSATHKVLTAPDATHRSIRSHQMVQVGVSTHAPVVVELAGGEQMLSVPVIFAN